MPLGSWEDEKTQTKNKHVCFYLSNNYLCWYKWAFWEGIILYHIGWRCKDSCWLKRTKGKWEQSGVNFCCDVRQDVIITGRFKWAANLKKCRFLIHQVVSKSASEHEINKWLAPVCFWFIFDGSDVSMEVKGLVVYSSGPWGWGRGVNRLSAAQESFHQDRECNPMEILESSEARDGE